MADFNKVLEPGDYKNGELNVVIEIPAGSNQKIEWDRKHACFMLDRVEPKAMAKPTNYGFIPKTIDEDGDELDILMITDEPLTTGIWTKARILGVMKFVDGGEVDDKVIVVPADDRNNGDKYQTLEDLPAQLLKQIEFHFNHYKDLKKPGSTEVKEFAGLDEAKDVIEKAIKRWNDKYDLATIAENAKDNVVTAVKKKVQEIKNK